MTYKHIQNIKIDSSRDLRMLSKIKSIFHRISFFEYKRCPICRSRGLRLFESSRSRCLMICPNCRHITWDKLPTEAELIKFYKNEYSNSHNQQNIQSSLRDYYRSHVRDLPELIKSTIEKCTIVDYGSSIPWLIREAKAIGYHRALAVDYDEASFSFAHEHELEIMNPIDFDVRIPDDSVDIIRYSHVLEHCIDPRKVIEEGTRKLRVGGLLYITHPGFPVFRAEYTGLKLQDSVYPSHLHFFSPLSMRALVANLPLKVTRYFTLTDHDEKYREMAPFLDLDTVREQLADWEAIGEPLRGEKASFPYYCGGNLGFHALKV